MPLSYEQICAYHLQLSAHEDPLLRRLEEEAVQEEFPIIGPAAGRFCHLMARATGARRIFELGSGYGYSTLWFARAVRANGGGEVHHTVWDEALQQRARRNLEEGGCADLVRFHLGEAVEALAAAEGLFDLVFNDIDKEGYPASLPVIKEKLRPGGLLIIDNMLWRGRIFDRADQSPETRCIRRFTTLLERDPSFLFQLVPIRDGLIVAMKVG